MPDVARTTRTDEDRPRIVTAQIIERGESHASAVPSKAGPREPYIPDDFMRALHQFACFLKAEGHNADDRFASLQSRLFKMSPNSRESAAQILDFILAVLSPLGEATPPTKPRRRAKIVE
jgi:hypothetical protein